MDGLEFFLYLFSILSSPRIDNATCGGENGRDLSHTHTNLCTFGRRMVGLVWGICIMGNHPEFDFEILHNNCMEG